MSLWPVCTLLVWCCVLSNCVTTKPLWLWAESFPLDLRCCWINQPMILPGLTPRNLFASHLQTCHWPKTPLSHLRMSILIHVAHQRRRKLTNDSLVILLCCDSVFRGVDPGQQKMMMIWAEALLDKITRCPSETTINSQLPSVGKASTLSSMIARYLDITEVDTFVVIHRRRAKMDDIKVDLGRLFRGGDAQVYSEHSDWVLILSGAWYKPWRKRQLRWAMVRYWESQSFGRNSIEL